LLKTSGHRSVGIQWRWFAANERPMPILRKVHVIIIMAHLAPHKPARESAPLRGRAAGLEDRGAQMRTI